MSTSPLPSGLIARSPDRHCQGLRRKNGPGTVWDRQLGLRHDESEWFLKKVESHGYLEVPEFEWTVWSSSFWFFDRSGGLNRGP